jgi:hypothetical protein
MLEMISLDVNLFKMYQLKYVIMTLFMYVCMYVNSSPTMVIPPTINIAFAHSVQEYLGQQNETQLQPSQSLTCHNQHKQSSTEPLMLLRKRQCNNRNTETNRILVWFIFLIYYWH